MIYQGPRRKRSSSVNTWCLIIYGRNLKALQQLFTSGGRKSADHPPSAPAPRPPPRDSISFIIIMENVIIFTSYSYKVGLRHCKIGAGRESSGDRQRTKNWNFGSTEEQFGNWESLPLAPSGKVWLMRVPRSLPEGPGPRGPLPGTAVEWTGPIIGLTSWRRSGVHISFRRCV